MTKLTLAKMAFGYLLLLLLGGLILTIALGRVHAESSYGLDQLIGGLLVIAGGFAHWAFGQDGDEEDKS
jgi:hypothetical protein